jgi:hypothetical protein
MSLSGCAAAELQSQAATIARLEGDLVALQTRALRIPDLQRQLNELRSSRDGLQERLNVAEQRLGMRPFHSEKVHVLPTPIPLDLPDAVRIEHVGGPAKRTGLRRHLADQRGTVIAFWATWCVPCTSDEELGHLATLQAELRSQNADLLSMAIDDLDKVRASPRASRWIHPLWHVMDGHMELPPREFIQRVGVNLPLFLVVDSAGRMHSYVNRRLDDETVRDLVTAVLQLR